MHEEGMVCSTGDDANLVAILGVPAGKAIHHIKPLSCVPGFRV